MQGIAPGLSVGGFEVCRFGIWGFIDNWIIGLSRQDMESASNDHKWSVRYLPLYVLILVIAYCHTSNINRSLTLFTGVPRINS